MPSTFTSSLRLTEQATGENLNTWGTILNSGTIELIDFAIAGRANFALSGPKTLTSVNGATDEARAAVLDIVSGTGGTVTIPSVPKIYLVRNASTGNAVFTTGSGVTATLAAASSAQVFCDGTNVRLILPTDFQGATLTSVGAPSLASDAATKAYADAILASANAYANGLSFNSGNLPSVAGQSGKYLTNDGVNPSWQPLTGTFSININGNSAGTHTGPVVGNVTGNVSGSSGSCTGNAATATNATNSANATFATAAGSASTSTTQAPGTNNTSIATTAFAQQLVSAYLPPGSGAIWYLPSPPTGWLECNGATLSRAAYPALNAVIAAQGYPAPWGAGDGSTTFVLPDMRGYFPRGWDNGRGVDPGRTFGSTQTDQIGPLSPTISTRQVQPASTGTFLVSGSTGTAQSTTVTLSTNTETRPINLGVMFIVKA